MSKEIFNIGDKVIYYSVIINEEKLFPKETEIISNAWQTMSGDVIIKVKGVSGGVSIRHLEEISQEDSGE
jgi:hypothetical protein